MRLLLALLATLVLAGPATAQDSPAHGLIENRTGLPLVFPLQIKTAAHRDAYMILRHAENGEIAVTAFIEGGRFFRLLMPPGTYTLDLAMGAKWRSKEALFGPETIFYTYPETLTFETRGLARKTGHLIDLRFYDQEVGVQSRSIALCQFTSRGTARAEPSAAPDGPRSVAPEVPFSYPTPPGPRDPGLDARPELGMEFGNTVADIPLWLRLGEGRDAVPDGPPRADPPRRRLRETLCG